MAIGISDSSVLWDLVGQRLHSFPHACAGDFSSYDSTLHPYVLSSVLRFYERFYPNATPEEREARRVLFAEVIYTSTVCRDGCFVSSQSNPSGCYFTSYLNSIAQLILLRTLWSIKMRREGYFELANGAAFQAHVYTLVYGDDQILGLTDFGKEHFGMLSLTKLFAEFGITYTDIAAGKTTATRDSIPHNEVIFLQRHFKKVKGHYIGVRELQACHQSIYWMFGPSIEQNFQSILDCYFNEIWRHGEKIFEETKAKISRRLKQTGTPYTFKPYKFWVTRHTRNFFLISGGHETELLQNPSL
jgi:hypothetical protein